MRALDSDTCGGCQIAVGETITSLTLSLQPDCNTSCRWKEVQQNDSLADGYVS